MADTPLTYATDVLGRIIEETERPLGWQMRGLSYTASGYGHIPTSRMVRFANAPKVWRRIWVMQYSNAGTAYVTERTKANPGRVLIVRDAELM